MPTSPPGPLDPELLRRIAGEAGTPVYVYDARIVDRRADRLEAMFEGLPVRFLYALKANFRPEIVRLLHGRGFGFDAVSPAEALLALRCGADPAEVLYTANNLTDAEMQELHEAGFLLNIGTCSRLERFGERFPGSAVCLRVNPDVGAGHHEHVITAGPDVKFGIPVDRLERARAIARRHDLRITGLHQHIGSGILEVPSLWKAVQVLLETADDFPRLEFLNFGGGLGIPYREDESELAIQEVRERITSPLTARSSSDTRGGLEYRFEPGRFLVGPAGVLLTRVHTLKETERTTFAGCDSGLNHLLRPALYGSYHRIDNLSRPDGPPATYDVVGNICESGDFLGRGREIAEIREGDLLRVHDAGAYGRAMASHYNLRSLPAEVWIDRDGTARTVHRRRSPRDLLEELDLTESSSRPGR